jgi:tetratricopeptide (TPR) repeat protein
MRLVLLKIFTMYLLASLGFGSIAQQRRSADKLFNAGCFAEAKSVYTKVVRNDPNHKHATIRMGYTALLLNQLDEAEHWLIKAKELSTSQTLINQFIAAVFYRRKDFSNASIYFSAIGRTSVVKKLASFNNQIPYDVDADFDQAAIPFIATEPLPFVRVVINGRREGNFIIDTGGGEIILDAEFAEECDAEIFGSETGNGFGGGKAGFLGHGKISILSLGTFHIRNVPVNTLPLRHIELAGIKIDGVIGTVFLYQFLSTIDYKSGCLILRNKEKHSFDKILQQTCHPVIVPFAMAGDHYMVSHGSLNDGTNMLWFIDTGLAGVGFTCPLSTIKKSKINVQKNNKRQGEGGGGSFDVFPFHVKKISLDSMCVNNVHGEFGAFPLQLEKGLGFKIDGLLSHEFFTGRSLTIDFKEMKYLLDTPDDL